jgi:hypothetical protein
VFGAAARRERELVNRMAIAIKKRIAPPVYMSFVELR